MSYTRDRPQAVLVGRTRDADDRVTWLLGAKRFGTALALAEEKRGGRRLVKQETYDKVGGLRFGVGWGRLHPRHPYVGRLGPVCTAPNQHAVVLPTRPTWPVP